MLTFPNAKINLGLNVVNKRPDGYHNIETLFYPIPVRDALEVIPRGDKDVFHAEGIPVEAAPADNLVMRALRLLQETYEIPPLEIYLLKSIPFGAGLGGGSSDAAFMLKLVNTLCELRITDERLEELAASIGADCPFFIRNTPVFATGIGNIFTPVELSLKGYHLCLVKPDIMVSTPEAYARVIPQTPTVNLKEIIQTPVDQWYKTMVNDFEASVFSRYPRIGQIKESFYQSGALYASMSGSGSSVFALYAESPDIDLQKQYPDCFVWQGILR